MPKLSAYYHPFICSPPLLTLSGNRKITQKVRIKHITPICQADASEREKTLRTNSYLWTLIQKRGGNECVLTKISHHFHCHFNAPTLCGGLQSHR